MTYKLSNVVYEHGDFWVLKVKNGYEVYKTGVTHSTRCASIGFTDQKGLNKAIEEINRRITS